MLNAVSPIKILPIFPKCLSFVHEDSIGDIEKCKITFKNPTMLRQIYETNQVTGVSSALVRSYEDGNFKYIININFIQKNLEKLYPTKQYPFVLIKTSPYNEYQNNIIDYLENNGYVLLS